MRDDTNCDTGRELRCAPRNIGALNKVTNKHKDVPTLIIRCTAPEADRFASDGAGILQLESPAYSCVRFTSCGLQHLVRVDLYCPVHCDGIITDSFPQVVCVNTEGTSLGNESGETTETSESCQDEVSRIASEPGA